MFNLEDLLGQRVVAAGRGERVEIGRGQERSGGERVGVADALASALGADELKEARPNALEPALLDESVREETGVAIGRAEHLAQLGRGDGLLAAPLEVEDHFGLVFRKGALGCNHDITLVYY